jgi:predicted GNAT superfamily acetyltransferase
MSGITIRDARPDDAEAILAINAQGEPGVTLLTPGDLPVLLARATLVRVAQTGSRLSGYIIGFSPDAEYDGEEYDWFRARLAAGGIAPFLYIDQVAVGVEARRSGVASALYADIVHAARGRGLGALACEVNLRPENPVSLRLHHGMGFREIGTLETRDGRRVSLLSRPLSA